MLAILGLYSNVPFLAIEPALGVLEGGDMGEELVI